MDRKRLDLRRIPAVFERVPNRVAHREQQSGHFAVSAHVRQSRSGPPLFTQDLNCHCFDPNAKFVLNPTAWANPPAGQFGSSAAYYSDYRTQRRPQENLNFGREWRVKERYKVQLRMEFTNILNRAYIGNPTSTNAQATQTRVANGNTASGFGYINTQC